MWAFELDSRLEARAFAIEEREIAKILTIVVDEVERVGARGVRSLSSARRSGIGRAGLDRVPETFDRTIYRHGRTHRLTG